MSPALLLTLTFAFDVGQALTLPASTNPPEHEPDGGAF
ncbi:hypothetical protein HDA35_004402 [Micromonospora purpureochromogenes]|uniref:Uncharacterized protein n=1 Tax=Micromonospora purpureochromogenes TaxID=47872 RepID=A0ABX2RTY6_9ACTN|nr:hypothetical protein [Micromonospora purpureochromogenes]